MEAALVELELTGEVWDASTALARRARAAGLTVPAEDLIVAACAGVYGIPIEHADKHFSKLLALL
jgi:predicted nucleic acid-binding protein